MVEIKSHTQRVRLKYLMCIQYINSQGNPLLSPNQHYTTSVQRRAGSASWMCEVEVKPYSFG